jgi:hypothetical protein
MEEHNFTTNPNPETASTSSANTNPTGECTLNMNDTFETAPNSLGSHALNDATA